MKTIAPALEVITNSYGSSFTYTKHAEKTNSKAHLWHYHPEIELVYINGGAGKRQIGSHVSYYNDGDLILIGSNLPHCGFTNEQTGNTNETVIQMKPDFLGNDFFDISEMKNIRNLFDQAKAGIAFGGETKKIIGHKIEAMDGQSQLEKLLSLLAILNELELSEEFKVLNAEGFSMEMQMQDNDRINTVFNHVKDHFQEAITLDEVAVLVSMTVPSFCRYFKKMTRLTFTEFLNQFRIEQAKRLLKEDKNVTETCYECGFESLSYFNRIFKKVVGQNPIQFKKN